MTEHVDSERLALPPLSQAHETLGALHVLLAPLPLAEHASEKPQASLVRKPSLFAAPAVWGGKGI